jgi:hypothetical protein
VDGSTPAKADPSEQGVYVVILSGQRSNHIENVLSVSKDDNRILQGELLETRHVKVRKISLEQFGHALAHRSSILSSCRLPPEGLRA